MKTEEEHQQRMKNITEKDIVRITELNIYYMQKILDRYIIKVDTPSEKDKKHKLTMLSCKMIDNTKNYEALNMLDGFITHLAMLKISKKLRLYIVKNFGSFQTEYIKAISELEKELNDDFHELPRESTYHPEGIQTKFLNLEYIGEPIKSTWTKRRQ